jgi:protein SCO1/2
MTARAQSQSGRALALLTLLLSMLAGAGDASAYMRNRGPIANVAPGEGRFSDSDINIIENLGQNLPRGLMFQDGRGQPVKLDDLLGADKPLLITMGYYRCPLLCNLVHEGLAKGLKAAGLQPGRDFQGAAVSVDPQEEPKTAMTNQRRLLRALASQDADGKQAAGKLVDDGHWPFLMPAPGHEKEVERLAEAVGFRYKYDPKSRQFAHAAVAFVLTPQGKISRYLYGVDFKPRDLRFSLVEASGGRVGTTLDRVLLTCFKYDPMTQRYTPYAFGFVRIGALLSAAALAVLLAVLWRREWINRRRRLA